MDNPHLPPPSGREDTGDARNPPAMTSAQNLMPASKNLESQQPFMTEAQVVSVYICFSIIATASQL